jgi:hypothetical protein
MRTSTIIITTIWVAIGIPLTIVMNTWTDHWWNPFDLRANVTLTDWGIWFFCVTFIILAPVYLICLFCLWLVRNWD